MTLGHEKATPSFMSPILWLDLEMTGLDDKKDRILEIAGVITDIHLKPLSEDFHRVIYQPKDVLDQMDEWCTNTHTASGLVAAISSVGIPLEKAEEELLKWCEPHWKKKKDRIILAGNSIWNDRKFIENYMPKLTSRLHYRMIDVSSFKELFKGMYGVEYKKKNNHRAVDDIYESIAELKEYLKLVTPPETTS